MKKIICILLTLTIIACLTACGCPEPTMPDLVFTFKDTEIIMHAQAQPIVKALGGPFQYTEAPSCAFDGTDKTYYYGSFYLTTYPKDGVDCISGLWFADDSVATAEGITIGSSRQAVEEAYGPEYFDGENAFEIPGKDATLTILLTGGMVSSVQYEAVFSY